jgi:hypothetical protein
MDLSESEPTEACRSRETVINHLLTLLPDSITHRSNVDALATAMMQTLTISDQTVAARPAKKSVEASATGAAGNGSAQQSTLKSQSNEPSPIGTALEMAWSSLSKIESQCDGSMPLLRTLTAGMIAMAYLSSPKLMQSKTYKIPDGVRVLLKSPLLWAIVQSEQGMWLHSNAKVAQYWNWFHPTRVHPSSALLYNPQSEDLHVGLFCALMLIPGVRGARSAKAPAWIEVFYTEDATDARGAVQNKPGETPDTDASATIVYDANSIMERVLRVVPQLTSHDIVLTPIA